MIIETLFTQQLQSTFIYERLRVFLQMLSAGKVKSKQGFNVRDVLKDQVLHQFHHPVYVAFDKGVPWCEMQTSYPMLCSSCNVTTAQQSHYSCQNRDREVEIVTLTEGVLQFGI